ncbi:hypothetical protein PMAYCL1PPCAC_09668, partial [Pristionchus mayeri]
MPIIIQVNNYISDIIHSFLRSLCSQLAPPTVLRIVVGPVGTVAVVSRTLVPIVESVSTVDKLRRAYGKQ